ncbi:hypothetical protein GCM10027161_44440 [Microbispora hainanensis]
MLRQGVKTARKFADGASLLADEGARGFPTAVKPPTASPKLSGLEGV